MKLTFTRIVVSSFAMFSIFFGAGNFVLPPFLGKEAGEQWLLVSLGFCLSAVLIPILGVIVQARLQGSVIDFGKKIHPIVGLLLGMLLYAICLVFPMPRTASVSYEMISASYDGTIPLWATYLFYLVYFSLVAFLCYQRNKVLDVLGKYLTPIMILIILLVIFQAIISDDKVVASASVAPIGIGKGLLEGYQTFDAMSSIIIGGVIVTSLFLSNTYDTYLVKRLTIYSGIGSGILLFVVYTGFIYTGASQGANFPEVTERVRLLSLITHHILGNVGGVLLSIAVCISCFTTAVGIITGGADFFKTITRGNERTYKIIVTILCIYSAIMAPIGVDSIIEIAYPILILFYPTVIVLIFLHLLPTSFASRTVFRVVGIVTFITSIPTFLKQIKVDFIKIPLPLHEYELSWILPAFCAWLATIIVEKFVVRK